MSNQKLILSAFEQFSGLKINFCKRALFCFGVAQDVIALYADTVKVSLRPAI
jgi:hypothetical protein